MRFAISANSAVVNRQIEVGVSKMEMTSDKFLYLRYKRFGL